MRDLGSSVAKKSVLGVLVDAVDYETALDRIVHAAKERVPYGVSAMAVHGVMTAFHDPEHLYRMNRMDLVTADGQPVRWFLNLKYGAGLADRVYGPTLTSKLLGRAADDGLPVYFYGSTPEVIARLLAVLPGRYPGLKIAGAEPSRFRCLQPEEKTSLVRRIQACGAAILFVGLGCPRQEIFAYEFKNDVSMPVLAVGAAFEYLAGVKSEPPLLLQRAGLQWLYRLLQEPRRLFYRYAVYNTQFVLLSCLELTGAYRAGLRRPEMVPLTEHMFG